MRKLKLQVQMSIDGFIGGPAGEMDWMTWNWTPDINQYVAEILNSVDTIVLGRKLAEGFIPYWASVAADDNNPEVESGKQFTNTSKVVFTKTLTEAEPAVAGWTNTILAKGDLAEEINALKNQDGKDIYACGGATFVSALIKEQLIDEFHLLVNPAAIGNGLTIFRDVQNKQQLKLIQAVPFECGIVALNYQLDRQ